MRVSKGLMPSTSASMGGESHDVSFIGLLFASKGAMPNWSEEAVF
jgi:hypothetical protein